MSDNLYAIYSSDGWFLGRKLFPEGISSTVRGTWCAGDVSSNNSYLFEDDTIDYLEYAHTYGCFPENHDIPSENYEAFKDFVELTRDIDCWVVCVNICDDGLALDFTDSERLCNG